VLATLALGSTHGYAADSTRTDVFSNLGRRVAIPAYEDLATTTTTLLQAMTTLCASNTPQNLDAARAAWLGAWEAWNRTRVFRFGRASFVTSYVAFPADPSKVEALAAGSQPAIGPPFTPDSLLQTGADVRGLETIEYALFTAELTGTLCNLAAASADLAASTASEIDEAWTNGVSGAAPLAQQLANPRHSELYDNQQQALNDIVNGMLQASTESTMALANTIRPTPGRMRSTVHTGTRIQGYIQSVGAAWRGSTKGKSGEGIETLVAAMSPSTAAQVSRALRNAERATKSLPPSLSDATPEPLQVRTSTFGD
jgi:predicted lipoprotein